MTNKQDNTPSQEGSKDDQILAEGEVKPTNSEQVVIGIKEDLDGIDAVEELPSVESVVVDNDVTPDSDSTKNEEGTNVPNGIQEILAFVDSIKDDLALRNERDRYKDEALSRMTKQISEYEKGFIKKIKEPVIKDVILFHDSLVKFQNKFKSIDNPDLQFEIELLQDEVEEILFSNDIEGIEERVGIPYDRDLHKVRKVVSTEVREEHLTIETIVKKGFTWEGQVTRKQEIIIKEHKGTIENE